MDKEFLESLGMTPEAAEAVMAAYGQALADVQESHRKAIAAMEFDRQLEKAVEAAGGRNFKAVTALLDLDALRNGGDMEQALKDLKKDSPYLFRERAAQPYAPFTGGASPEPKEPETLAGALRERFGI